MSPLECFKHPFKYKEDLVVLLTPYSMKLFLWKSKLLASQFNSFMTGIPISSGFCSALEQIFKSQAKYFHPFSYIPILKIFNTF